MNYKSFSDSGDLKFSRGINILIGPNNSGKTALLQALSLETSNKPHLSESRKPTRESLPSPVSEKIISITLSPDELRRWLDGNGKQVVLPMPITGQVKEVVTNFKNALVKGFTIKAKHVGKGIESDDLDYGYNRAPSGQVGSYATLREEPNGQYVFENATASQNVDIGRDIVKKIKPRIYRFHAERLNVSMSPVGHRSELEPNAANLPEVLQVLHTSNPETFRQYMSFVTGVLPSVKWVTVPTDVNSQACIRVWPIDHRSGRDDLSIPLSECGTGIGQVLAILYIVVTASSPRIILIDEPQSFLHPSAAKTLVRLLGEFHDHQYFISTHSPDVLSLATNSTVTALTYSESRSTAKGLNLTETGELRAVLDSIGTSFSDVFFAERILWVEGPTEQKAFPKILEHFEPKIMAGMSILPLANTGGVQSKKHGRLVFDIYKKLSGAHALVPPIVAVVLDREKLTEGEIQELSRSSEGLLQLLPRRMYENYLLNPDAIAHVLNQEDAKRPESRPVTREQVHEFLEHARTTRKYCNSATSDTGSENSGWISTVDASLLLSKLFHELSDGELFFSKPDTSVELTVWLLVNKPEELRELADFLSNVINNGPSAEFS